MVLAGVLERHPRLRVLLAHAGGAVLALRGRLRHGHATVAAAGERLHEPPDDSLRRLHYDTITHDPSLLRAVVEFAGADRVLLGSDQPFDMADPRPVETVRAAGLDHEAEAAVLGANAARLLGLEVPAR
jgi:aminocarboxymuconate-semialdehyde decarboxylase